MFARNYNLIGRKPLICRSVLLRFLISVAAVIASTVTAAGTDDILLRPINPFKPADSAAQIPATRRRSGEHRTGGESGLRRLEEQ